MSVFEAKVGLSTADKTNMKNEIYNDVKGDVDDYVSEKNTEINGFKQSVTDDFNELSRQVEGTLEAQTETIQGLGQLRPSGTATHTVIEGYTTKQGDVLIATDTGHWYYWDATDSEYKDGGVYQATAIADDSVTPPKTSFINYSNQLFNKNDVKVGYYNYNTGVYSGNNTYRNCKIYVNGSFTFTINKICHIAFFDKSDNYINGLVNTSDSDNTFTTTAATYYMYVSILATSLDTVMLNYGSSILTLDDYVKPKLNDVITHYIEQEEFDEYAYTITNETLDTNTFELYQENAYVQNDGTLGTSTGRNVYKISCKDLLTLKVNMGSGSVTLVPLMNLYNSNGVLINTYYQNDITDVTLTIDDITNDTNSYFLITRWRNDENLNTTVTISMKVNNYVKNRIFNGKKAVFFGDSITQGYTSGTTTTTENYVKLFSNSKHLIYNNQGVAGSLFTSGYNSIQSITNKITTISLTWLNSFDYLFIAGGVNDCQLGVTESDFKNAIITLTNYLKTNYKGKVIFILPINFTKTFTAQTLDINVYRNWINLYAKLNDFVVVDGGMFKFPNTAGALSDLLFGDGLHPTELGYQLYTKELINNLYIILNVN